MLSVVVIVREGINNMFHILGMGNKHIENDTKPKVISDAPFIIKGMDTPGVNTHSMYSEPWRHTNVTDSGDICDYMRLDNEEDTDDSGFHCSDTSNGNNDCHDNSFLDCTEDSNDDEGFDVGRVTEANNFRSLHANTRTSAKVNTCQTQRTCVESEVVMLSADTCHLSKGTVADVSDGQSSSERVLVGDSAKNFERDYTNDQDISDDDMDVQQVPPNEIQHGPDQDHCYENESIDDDKDSTTEGVEVPEIAESSSEGGWISEENETCNKENSEDTSDDEMFDLFGENNVITYEVDDEDDDESMKIVTSSVRGPALPQRTYRNKVYSYSPKRPAHKHQTVRTGRGPNSVNDSFNCYEDDKDMYAMIAAASGAPSAAKRNTYAFPRVDFDDISDITEIWETDFQVNKTIIPRMSSWESLGLVPDRKTNLADFNLYTTYKSLYDKWIQCHSSKDQWYRKYGLSSLEKVLYMTRKPYKLYPDECKPIRGLKEKLEMFELYYDSLTMTTSTMTTEHL